MTNPSDPYPGPGGTPRSGQGGAGQPGHSGGPSPVDYSSYRYPAGDAEPTQSAAGGPGGYEAYGTYGVGGRQTGRPDAGYAGVAPHDQFSYGGVGDWGEQEKKNSVAPWALAASLLGFLAGLTVIGAVLSFLPGVIGLILGIIGIVRASRIRGPRRRMGMSVVAVVFSVLAILMTVGLLAFAAFLSDSGAMDCLMLPAPEQQTACLEDWARSNLD